MGYLYLEENTKRIIELIKKGLDMAEEEKRREIEGLAEASVKEEKAELTKMSGLSLKEPQRDDKGLQEDIL